ncbi:hypothetical protein [Dulcicalothrix desertica]|nr:hypothetical protein [Dulcicalothrix desertica]
MSYSASPANSSFVHRAIDTLKVAIPNVVVSLVVSVAASVVLTGLAYSLNAAFGIPVIPFFFIML